MHFALQNYTKKMTLANNLRFFICICPKIVVPLRQNFDTMRKYFTLSLALIAATMSFSQSSGFRKLDEWTECWKNGQQTYFGYPANQQSPLHEFYEWYLATGLDVINLNNAGDPMTDEPWKMSSHAFERDVIEFFAPLYGFERDKVWGIVTHSGTDGNNHGIYFGANYLFNKTGKRPVVYVSDEAHYSNMRLCDLQNLEVRLIKSDNMGRMIPEELEKALDTSRPALMVYAMGSTFKGAIDDQDALNAVLDRHPEVPVYRHVDAALFGGYLPFTKYKNLVSHEKMRFDAIAISGHKFFGIDSPSGLFLCTRETYDNQNNFNVTYLNSNMKMINCSRDAIQPLKFWWLIRKVGYDQWSEQANQMMECTAYLKQQLDKIGWPCWNNEYSNTVFFKRPSKKICNEYLLALGYDERFGGELAHVVVMQHVTKEKIDKFVSALAADQ
jgi:histidine decarboxylase